MQLGKLRDMYEKFEELNCEIIALGPDGPRAFKKYWEEEKIPYIGCPDIGSKVADTFHQEVNLFKLGRMPAEFIIGAQGEVLFSHFGKSMSDIPDPKELLRIVCDYKELS